MQVSAVDSVWTRKWPYVPKELATELAKFTAEPAPESPPVSGASGKTTGESTPISSTSQDTRVASGSLKQSGGVRLLGSKELTSGEQEQVKKLQARDREVRAHEAAHLAAAGSAAAGGATYTYQLGPDGKFYAIGGEVPIKLAPGRTPEETRAQAEQIRAAALAPDEPSGQDMQVAAEAEQMESQAMQQIAAESKSSGTAQQISTAYGQSESSSSPQLVSAKA